VREYHSHPKQGALASLSDDDLNYCLRENQEGRKILGRDWVEIVVRINETKTKGNNQETIYENYNYQKAERFYISSADKTYDVTLSAWFIKQKQDEIDPVQGTVWIEWPIRQKICKTFRLGFYLQSYKE
jgi:hypothetical protein